MAIKHVTIKAPGNKLFAIADWNASHTIDPNTITYAQTTFADQNLKITSGPTFASITINGNITVTGTVDGIDISVDVAANTAARHTQNTDTALGSGAVAADHGAAATDQIINVCYGTSDPPAANTTTEGAIFIKYTA